MLFRHLILSALACAAVCPAAEDQERERLRAELKQVSGELARLSHAFNLIHELVAPSVVSIHTRERRSIPNPYSGRFVIREVEVGEGSGFIFHADDKASYILTNSHVVLQTNADQQFVSGANGQPVGYDRVRVALTDNREMDAEYVGVYLQTDLAVLKIAIPHLPALEWADSDQAKVGDWVLALGYPLGVGYSATSGIISATDRSTGIYQSVGGFDSFIQTDAAINPGNSGGPLVDIQGKVIGINASIISKTGVNIGLGFAIPSNLGKHVAADLLKHGRVRRPMVGVQIEDVGPDQAKALGLPQVQTIRITTVVPGSPAAKAELQKGDVILGVNRARVVSLQQFQARIASSTLGDTLQFHIWRAGTELDRMVTPIAEDELERTLAVAAKETAQRQGLPLRAFGMWVGTDDRPGLRVTLVEDGGLAAQAGLKVGDRLLHERSVGPLRGADEVAELNKLPELTLQIHQDGRNLWVRLRR
jgi:serine protease Do